MFESLGAYTRATAKLNRLASKSVGKVYLAIVNETQPRPISWICRVTGLEQSTCSNAVTALRQVGMITYQQSGRERLVALDKEGAQWVKSILEEITKTAQKATQQ